MPEQKHQARQRILEFPARPEYSFSNFVVSKGSDVAFQAAREICADKPSPRNTLYLFGGKNLGKTHLLISIGNETAAQGKKAMYVHGSDFVPQTDENANGSTGQFVSTFHIDLFLLDAVDHISGQRASQEKLYLVYNTLIETKKNRFRRKLEPDPARCNRKLYNLTVSMGDGRPIETHRRRYHRKNHPQTGQGPRTGHPGKYCRLSPRTHPARLSIN